MAGKPSNETVHLNLDSIEREDVKGVPRKKAKPYAVVFGDRRYEFADASELNYLILATMTDTPDRFFRSALSPDDYKAFSKAAQPDPDDPRSGLSGIKLRAIMNGYQDYYGLDAAGNALGS